MRIDVKSCPAGLWQLDLVKVQQNVFAEQAVPAMYRTMRELRTRLFSAYRELCRFRESVKDVSNTSYPVSLAYPLSASERYMDKL